MNDNEANDYILDAINTTVSEKHQTNGQKKVTDEPGSVGIDDFYAYAPENRFIFVPTRDQWSAPAVNARIPNVDNLKATTWLSQNRSVEQITWCPGYPMLIKDRLVANGGFIHHTGVTTFNLYQPPNIKPGDENEAFLWVDHVYRVYPDDADHILSWLAYKVQHPGDKINHALVLGGTQGIGKDTLLEPVRHAVGPWNFEDITPTQLIGRFNGFVKSVILRISEARDMGDVDRFGFYEHLKIYTASPPSVLRCDEKNRREYGVMNVCSVIITTNHKAGGIHLPADDRRHYVAWSDAQKTDFTRSYWSDLWQWYESGGYAHIAAYLKTRPISSFDPKAPPHKTNAFWDIVDAGRAPEDAELADVLDQLDNPNAVTIDMIASKATGDFYDFLNDRKNRRQIPHRFEAAGYVPVRNEAAKDGLWKIAGKRQMVYAKRDLTIRDRIQGAQKLNP